MSKRALLLAMTIGLVLPGLAAERAAHADRSWARATAPGAENGGVYMKLENPGPANDRLLKVSGDVAAAVELHTHQLEGGIARMREVAAIDVPAGKGAELKPGGPHLMLIGLRRPLKEGETFPLTLQFEKAGTQIVDVVVHGIGAVSPGHAMPGGDTGGHGR